MNLRSRILQDGIRCQPWQWVKGEIKLLPVSSQTCFRNDGLSWDVLEISLKQEGYLREDEELWQVLAAGDLKRVPFGQENFIINDPRDGWVEEDFNCPALCEL